MTPAIEASVGRRDGGAAQRRWRHRSHGWAGPEGGAEQEEEGGREARDRQEDGGSCGGGGRRRKTLRGERDGHVRAVMGVI
jgi:hypothetical protein